jgi:ferritin
MKLSQNLNDVLNQQVLIEYGNELKYAQIQSYFEDLQLKKLSEYFKKQAIGENDHAQLFMQHINDRTGGKVALGEIDAPQVEFTSVSEIGDFYIKTEESTTESIELLYDLAFFEKSYIDLPFLAKMLDEQCEEEDAAQKLSLNLKMTKDIVLFDQTFEG